MSDVELTISAGQREPGPVRLVATLVTAATLSGLALASAYQVTKPVIDRNTAEALQAAIFEVVPGATATRRFALVDGALVPADGAEPVAGPVIHAGYGADGAFIGYAIDGAGSGFQDTIRVLHGYDPAGARVIGMRILESRETPGLGDKIWKDDAFVARFEDLAATPPIVVVKDGADAPNEVDAITGATISSKAVVRIVNEGNVAWVDVLPAPGTEPTAPPPDDAAGDAVTGEEG